jgi:hypothetical protein
MAFFAFLFFLLIAFLVGWGMFYIDFKKKIVSGFMPYLDDSGSVAWQKSAKQSASQAVE